MSTLFKSVFGLAVFCVVLFATLALLPPNDAASFFKAALRAQHASSTVVVEGRTYAVQSGVVSAASTDATPEEVLRALEIAYALESARAHPLLGIAGSDARLLAQAAVRLGNAEKSLVALQPDEEARATMRGLYPVSYLQALATAETMRQQFVLSGQDDDYEAYMASLGVAVSEGAAYADQLLAELSKELAATTLKIVTAGGSITSHDAPQSVRDIADAFTMLAQELAERRACISGEYMLCDTAYIQPALPLGASGAKASTQAIELAHDIRSLFAEASQVPAAGSPIIALQESTCITVIPGPYLFAFNAEHRAQFVADMFFKPTAETAQGVVARYAAQRYGASYFFNNPLAFYACPDTLHDVSRLEAVTATAEFAQHHPLLAAKRRDALLTKEVWYESDARAYLREALADTRALRALPQEELDALYACARMFAEGRAGLDLLVQQVATTLGHHLDARSSGEPFDLSARLLLLTHAAPSSLVSVGQPPARKQYSADDAAAFLSAFEQYSDLRGSVGRQKILEDMETFYRIERVLP